MLNYNLLVRFLQNLRMTYKKFKISIVAKKYMKYHRDHKSFNPLYLHTFYLNHKTSKHQIFLSITK